MRFHTSTVPRASRTSPCAGGGLEHAIATLCRKLEFAIDQHYDVLRRAAATDSTI
jgi:hypothetical protein